MEQFDVNTLSLPDSQTAQLAAEYLDASHALDVDPLNAAIRERVNGIFDQVEQSSGGNRVVNALRIGKALTYLAVGMAVRTPMIYRMVQAEKRLSAKFNEDTYSTPYPTESRSLNYYFEVDDLAHTLLAQRDHADFN